jgi:hypothetical protein
MKHVKILGLLAVAAAAMMSFAASASADYLSTSTGGAAATPNIHAVSEGHVTLKNPIANISCNSTTSGAPTSHGAGLNVSGPISNLDWSSCTNSWHVTTLAPGSLSVSAIAGSYNGTLTSNGAKVATTRFGINCVYETKNTHIGTVTGGSSATLHVKASIPINTGESSGLCGTADSAWEGGYTTTEALYVNDN